MILDVECLQFVDNLTNLESLISLLLLPYKIMSTIMLNKKKRILYRQTSKDDSHLKEVIDNKEACIGTSTTSTTTTPSGKTNSGRRKLVSKKSFDDLHCDVRSSRVDRLKVQFVEVYIGKQQFTSGKIKVDIIICIFLQACDRLYEIVLIDEKKKVEIVRFYVTEDEIQHRMQLRYVSLEALHQRRSSLSVDTNDSVAIKLPPLSPTSTSTSPLQSPTFAGRFVFFNKSSKEHRSKCGEHDVSDGVPLQTELVAGEHKARLNSKVYETVTVEDMNAVRKKGLNPDCADIATVQSVIENDISAVSEKGIQYYSAVIVHFLHCRFKLKKPSFYLFDGSYLFQWNLQCVFLIYFYGRCLEGFLRYFQCYSFFDQKYCAHFC